MEPPGGTSTQSAAIRSRADDRRSPYGCDVLLRRQSTQPRTTRTASALETELDVALQPLLLDDDGVTTDAAALACLVESRRAVATTVYTPGMVAVNTPASVTLAPLEGLTDQTTPAVLAAPSTVAVKVVLVPVVSPMEEGETDTEENNRMTMKPLS
jgi:hypothetical protein